MTERHQRCKCRKVRPVEYGQPVAAPIPDSKQWEWEWKWQKLPKRIANSTKLKQNPNAYASESKIEGRRRLDMKLVQPWRSSLDCAEKSGVSLGVG